MEEDSKGSVSLPGQRESELLGEKKNRGGLPQCLGGKESTYNAGDMSLIPG